MRVMTILGTRPEIIRLALVIQGLDRLCDHILVDTRQNFDQSLSSDVFRDLGVRDPDERLAIGSPTTFGSQIGSILAGVERLIASASPDRILVLGDTNTALSAIVAKRMGIPVFHMEAGNRCYDDRVPEEVNRRLIDHCSDVLMPYTERSRLNLLREGISGSRIFVTGNPIFEILENYSVAINSSDVLRRLGLAPSSYVLATIHRAENVDSPSRLNALVDAIAKISAAYNLPVVVSTHPRTRNRLEEVAYSPPSDRVRFLPPFGFFDFIQLEKQAFCVLTDSGTVQEECCILGKPVVTLRDSTERPETIECGSNILSGVRAEAILSAMNVVLADNTPWRVPQEYLAPNVSSSSVRIILGEKTYF